MDITVIGATGGTGRQVVAQALAAGHRVTAVVRDPARLPAFPVPAVRSGSAASSAASSAGELVVVTADVMKVEDLRPAVRGRDAVVTALGPSGRHPRPVVTPALDTLISAMWAENVSRVVLVSNSGMHTEGDPLLLRAVAKPILQRVLRDAYADAMRAEELLRSTELEWTIARPPRLTNGPHTGTYRMARSGNVRGGSSISRADLADFLLRAASDRATSRQAISLGY
ncbi:NAD(P)-binding oxidoreductase [Actinoplanes sp. NPDC051633]|uniref:NAD(P)-dependent oxidoreductase n=1 Tax=Actinoplanes sp. NPDC051633 TaxID=3155670 RepID=UPI003443CAFD